MKSKPTLLIFPANIDGSENIAKLAKQLGFSVIGACSVEMTANTLHFDKKISLPFITDKSFDQIFEKEIASHGVTHIYAPHHGVWWHFKNSLPENSTNNESIKLCGSHPFNNNWDDFEPHIIWANEALESSLASNIAPIVPISPKLNRMQYSALHKGFLQIPGESDGEKLLAISDIARLLPRGDIVEIGSLYGRSAYALTRMAQHYDLGSTICVDPWCMGKIVDQGSAAKELFDSRSLIDLNQVFMQFCTMAAEVEGIGYIRSTSAEGIHTYRQAAEDRYLRCDHLNDINIQGKISLLHIDGNHRYDHVVKDIETWSPHLQAGGWLLLDDYVWAFGDGPQRAGDDLLHSGQYDLAFVASDTLFLRRC